MYERDHAARALGIVLDAIGPGVARMSMAVRADMVNGHGTCHGGLIFTLADTAFAYACNAANRVTVAAGADIVFLAPAHEGDRLVASAACSGEAGRSGVYDVAVATGDGRQIALFRGRSHRLQGAVVAPAADPASPSPQPR